jgi:hypothetical protein
MQFSMHYLLRLDVLVKEMGERDRQTAVATLIHEAFEKLPAKKRKLPEGWNYGDVGYRGTKPGVHLKGSY